MQTPALLAERGFSLRWLRDADLPWLRTLYASTREEEMAPVPWTALMKRNFLDQQFALQHTHFIQHFGDSDFLAIERTNKRTHAQGRQQPIGRYYLQRNAPEHLIVDIALMPEARSQGIGRILIETSQSEAQALGHGMQLHVATHNDKARRLYERLGFVMTDTGPTHHLMVWSPASKD